MSDSDWMRQALDLARLARFQGEVPVGAVLVSEHNQKIGVGWNQVVQTNDPTAHAEMLAIKNASSYLENYRLEDTTLYVTLEPCSMCAGALVHARIKRVVFGTRDLKAGAAGSIHNLLQGFPLNHQIQIDEGFLQQKCASLLTDFFKSRR